MDASKYVGKPWVAGASGPEAFDCWGLVRHWYLKRFNKKLPDFAAEAVDYIQIARKFHYEEQNPDWTELPHPVKDCVVAMGKSKQVTHAGVYIGGKLVLHCSGDAKRCVIQSLEQIQRQWSVLKYYVPFDSDC